MSAGGVGGNENKKIKIDAYCGCKDTAFPVFSFSNSAVFLERFPPLD